MDIVGAADANNLVYWLEQDSLRHFTQHLVDSVLYPRHAHCYDIDLDGDIDIVSQSGHAPYPARADSVLWFENDGNENFTKHWVATLSIPYDQDCADMDGDGDIDIIGCSYWSDCIYFYRNQGNCTAWDTIPITLSFDGAYEIELVDFDDDGDLDVICPCNRENFIAWFEADSVNDSLVFIQHDIPLTVTWASEADPIDIDFDGDYDLVACGNEDYIWWIESHLYEPYAISLELIPTNPPITVPAGGGNFEFDAVIANTGTETFNVNAYIDITLPGGTIYPILQRPLTITPGFSSTRHLTQFIPASAMPGEYCYNGHLADSQVWNIYAEDSFDFLKADGDNVPTHDQGWALYGWDEEAAANAILDYALMPAFPNPFNPETRLTFTLPQAAEVSIVVFDVQGREVAKLAEGWHNSGRYEVNFDASGLSSGLYFARMTSGSFNQTQKLLLTK